MPPPPRKKPKVEFDPSVEEWPDDPDELLEFVQGIPDDGQRRLGTAMAKALITYRAVVVESATDRIDLRKRLKALEAAAAPEPTPEEA